MLECMNELELASRGGFRSKKDDFIDTISMLASMTAWKPSETADMTKDKNDLWSMDEGDQEPDALASYIV